MVQDPYQGEPHRFGVVPGGSRDQTSVHMSPSEDGYVTAKDTPSARGRLPILLPDRVEKRGDEQ